MPRRSVFASIFLLRLLLATATRIREGRVARGPLNRCTIQWKMNDQVASVSFGIKAGCRIGCSMTSAHYDKHFPKAFEVERHDEAVSCIDRKTKTELFTLRGAFASDEHAVLQCFEKYKVLATVDFSPQSGKQTLHVHYNQSKLTFDYSKCDTKACSGDDCEDSTLPVMPFKIGDRTAAEKVFIIDWLANFVSGGQSDSDAARRYIEEVLGLHQPSMVLPHKPLDAVFELFAIGDSHGNPEHLQNALLATGKFEIADNGLQWKSCEALGTNACGSGEDHAPFRIYVLGDVVDRGVHGLSMLLSLKILSEDAQRGHLLKVLLGNHESMALEAEERYATGDWDGLVRRAGFLEMEGGDMRSKTAFHWLRTLDVLALDHGVLLCHGGLSYETLQKVLPPTPPSSPAQQKQLVLQINDDARHFYSSTLTCFRELQGEDLTLFLNGNLSFSKDKCPPVPPILSDDYYGNSEDAGILWFRGYSQAAELIGMKVNHAKVNDEDAAIMAGTDHSCVLAGRVGATLGATSMVVAHTTHRFQVKYCDGGPVPVYAIDTNSETHKGDHEDDAKQPFKVDHSSWPVSAPQALRIVEGDAAACIKDIGCHSDAIARYLRPSAV